MLDRISFANPFGGISQHTKPNHLVILGFFVQNQHQAAVLNNKKPTTGNSISAMYWIGLASLIQLGGFHNPRSLITL